MSKGEGGRRRDRILPIEPFLCKFTGATDQKPSFHLKGFFLEEAPSHASLPRAIKRSSVCSDSKKSFNRGQFPPTKKDHNNTYSYFFDFFCAGF